MHASSQHICKEGNNITSSGAPNINAEYNIIVREYSLPLWISFWLVIIIVQKSARDKYVIYMRAPKGGNLILKFHRQRSLYNSLPWSAEFQAMSSP